MWVYRNTWNTRRTQKLEKHRFLTFLIFRSFHDKICLKYLKAFFSFTRFLVVVKNNKLTRPPETENLGRGTTAKGAFLTQFKNLGLKNT